MKLLFKIFICAATVLMLGSCSPYLYAPNTLNMPLARARKEAKLKAYTGLHDFGYQASYAISNHLVAFTNGSFFRNLISTPSSSSSRTFMEGGIGYYHKIEENGCWEVLGGYGNGTGIAHYQQTPLIMFGPPAYSFEDLSGNYQKLYFQPDVGFAHHQLEMGLGCRFSVLYLHNVDYTSWYQEKQSGRIYSYQSSHYNQKVFPVEPCLHFAFGDDATKIFMSVGTTNFQSGSYVDENLKNLFLTSFFSLGISINLGRDFGE